MEQNNMISFEDDEAIENLDLIKFGDFLLEDDLIIGEDCFGVEQLQNHVKRLSIDLFQTELHRRSSIGQMNPDNYRRFSMNLMRRRDSLLDSSYHATKKRTFDECVTVATTTSDKKKRTSHLPNNSFSPSRSDNLDTNLPYSPPMCGSGNNLSTILSLMSEEQLTEQLERSASRLADSMKRSEASRNKVLETHDQSCLEPEDVTVSNKPRSPFNLSAISSGLTSYMSHMTNNSML